MKALVLISLAVLALTSAGCAMYAGHPHHYYYYDEPPVVVVEPVPPPPPPVFFYYGPGPGPHYGPPHRHWR